jgi:23S rRNA-intervening sequence protein
MEPGARSREQESRGGSKEQGREASEQKMNEPQFRFQDLEIWKRGAAISSELFRLAENLEERRLFRFADQLRGATLSITNNIARPVK